MRLLVAQSVGVGPSASDIAASVTYAIGLTALIGGATADLLDQARERLRRAIPVAWIVAAIGAIAIGYLHLRTFDLPLGEFVSGYTLGKGAVLRFGALLLAWIGVVLVARKHRYGMPIVLIGAAASAFGHAMGGHANIAAMPLLHRTWHAMHLVAIGAWIGGLAAVLWSTLGEATETKARLVRRFSSLAGFLIVVVVATGILRAMDTVGFSFGALTETNYGRLVLLKSELLLLLVAFGAHNRYHEVPRAHRVLSGLRRFGLAELAVATIVFGTTGVLAGTEPAAEAWGQREPEPPAIEQLDDGVTISSRETPDGITLYTATWPDGVEAQAYLDPEQPGYNELHVTLFGDDGRELPLARLLTFDGRSQPVWAEPTRFSKGHFTIGAELREGTSVYAFHAVGAAGSGRWRLVLLLEI